MAFTVETGDSVTGANAYAAVADVDTYHTDRNHTDWTGTTALKQAAIIRASEYIDKRFGRKFRGFRRQRTQGLEWPRLSALDNDGYLFDNIPSQLFKAVSEYALRALMFGELAPDVPPNVPRQDHSDGVTTLGNTDTVITGAVKALTEKVGPIETRTEYHQPGASTTVGNRSSQSSLIDDSSIPEYPAADLWIEEMLKSGSSRTLVRG